MAESNERESIETNTGETKVESGSGKTNEERKGIESFLNVLVQQIELVSKHFGYTEEYVMSHTPKWLSRKFEQARREQFESHQANVMGNFQSFMLLLDSVLNKGENFNTILPPSIEAMMNQSIEKQQEQSEFVTEIWWKKKSNSDI